MALGLSGIVRQAGGLLLVGALLAGCGSPAAPAAPAAAKPAAQPAPASAPATLEPVTVRLDYVINGYHAPFFAAVDKGYYKAAGIDASVQEGKGSVTTIETVANGSDAFGYVDGGTLIQASSKGMPVVAVAGLLGKSLTSVLVRADSDMHTPKDMAGHVFGSSPGGAAESLFPAFAQANGLDLGKVKTVSVGGAAKFQALAGGKVDAITTSAVAAPEIEKAGAKVRVLPYADYGLNLPGMVVIVSKGYLAAHADLVRRFLAATMKGFEYAKAHPEEAAQIVHARFPNAPEQALLEELKIALPFEHTQATQGKPAGWMSLSDWQEAAALEQQAGLFKGSVQLDQLISNDYLPR